jgi:hypothetical protein
MNMTAYDAKHVALYARHACDKLQAWQIVTNSPYHVRTAYIRYRGRRYDMDQIKSWAQPITEIERII